MKITQKELISILAQFNPWWKNSNIPDLPAWHRGVFSELLLWIQSPPAQRAILLSGPRQVGKTVLILQTIQALLDSGVPPANILYVTFDHPICKLAGLDGVLGAWRELEPKAPGPEYVFLDEAQFIKNIGTWVKHRVDFFKTTRVIFTESATPLIQADQESGVGRWHTIEVSTLSFYEYLQIKNISLPAIPTIDSIHSLHTLSQRDFLSMSHAATALTGHFHEYLIRGGFPQTALIDSITQSQRLLREDIVDKVLKRDMTALFGVRRIFELEQMFIFLCMHDGGIQDITTVSKELGIAKQTVQNFIDLFESAHLIYKLPPFGYGKEVLRGKSKIYLSDPAMASAILLKGKTILEHPHALGQCVETAIICHLWSHCRANRSLFSYWRSQKGKEVDFIVEVNGSIVPFEVKYQSHDVERRDIPGLIELTKQRPAITSGYIVTKGATDLGPLSAQKSPSYVKIPASLLCYWLGEAEFQQKNLLL